MSNSDLNDLIEDVQYMSPMGEVSSVEGGNGGNTSPISSMAKRVLIAQEFQRKVDDIEDILAETDSTSKLRATESFKEGYNITQGTSSTSVYDDVRKYKLLHVDEPSYICGNAMGQGVTFCTNRNCNINHRGIETWKLIKGHLYVLKSTEKGRSTAFTLPTISSPDVDEEVVEKWLNMSQTLYGWSQILRLTKNTIEGWGFSRQRKSYEGKEGHEKCEVFQDSQKRDSSKPDG